MSSYPKTPWCPSRRGRVGVGCNAERKRLDRKKGVMVFSSRKRNGRRHWKTTKQPDGCVKRRWKGAKQKGETEKGQ